MSGENQALTPLGLDEHEEELYRLLVDRPGLTLAQCEGLVDASTAAAFPGLAERLVARGLLIQEEPGPTFRASPPALALGPLVAARQEELQQVKATVATLADHFRASHTVPPGSPVEVVLGREAVAHRFLQLQLAARREILGMMPVLGDSAVVASDENTAEADAIRRGVRYHVVIPRDWLEQPAAERQTQWALDAGQRITVVDQIPVQAVIADRAMAMVPLSSGGAASEPAVTIVHESGLVQALAALFDLVAAGGWPLVAAGTHHGAGAEAAPRLDEVDQKVLALLQAGQTDTGIARHTGTSLRSLQRRIHRLMSLAGANSRFQLGCHAVRSGWLPPDEDEATT
ncbi:helix-turn-helix transcriptional regulator [Ornithinimicrobium murale]|uniref:helix-turn-helix transcriptional regulator n=1 Tax=Ornithinimicrobium murale TaxID=1050153 RepID=UPI000E0DE66F|nr:helix-turn-helix transcriptional regulator [Ornithinimicrobium murale]